MRTNKSGKMATSLGPPKRRQVTEGTNQTSKKVSRPSSFQRRSTLNQTSGAVRTSALPRNSTSLGRPSDRNSSVFGQSAVGTLKKDPRPLTDKSYQQGCVRRLCAFLTTNGYTRDVKPRTLMQAPSTKEFLYILNFLLEFHSSFLTVNGIKLEEEIPYTLKLLGYPFSVSKNHLLSIGSPHSWPIMLGVLVWLMEPLETNLFNPVFYNKENNHPTQTKVKFDEFTQLYHLFLERGEDDYFKQTIEDMMKCTSKY
jgi:kinetochore protein NDC80